MMRVLIVGSGGREHALAWKIAQSPLVHQVYCAPGNAGMARVAECVAIGAEDLDGLADWAQANRIDLTVVGPEVPLANGIVNRFAARGLPIFGPTQAAARLESSKRFAKDLMRQAGIPTADFWVCDGLAEAQDCVRHYYKARTADTRIVLKADGLAAGKGVILADSEAEANAALTRLMHERVFGDAGANVVIEEFLTGEEASIMAITDGETIIPLLPSQDHKRAYDGDRGPNTGGMGAYSPVPTLPADIVSETVERIIRPAVRAMAALGTPYQGVLYAGIMHTSDGVKTIEFNCRLGDPETQTILPLLDSDLVPLLLAATGGTLAEEAIRWKPQASVCVVAASEGYPERFDPGMDTGPFLNRAIAGLDAVREPEAFVFQAGTCLSEGETRTAGGRVLSVTGVGDGLQEAAARAYAGLETIQFPGMHYRRDIGHRALTPS